MLWRYIESHDLSFHVSCTGDQSSQRISAHSHVNGQRTDDRVHSVALFISPSEKIVSSVSVSHPLSDELYYQLCKQSVDMCCCLATSWKGEKWDECVALFVCIYTHAGCNV